MQRNTATFGIANVTFFKRQMLNWANQFSICCFLDTHAYGGNLNAYDCLLGAGAQTVFSPTHNILGQLKEFCKTRKDWLFGHFNYDLKNEIEPLTSEGIDNIRFPETFLFQPAIVIELIGNAVTVSSLTLPPTEIFEQILAFALPINSPTAADVVINPRISKGAYLTAVEKIRQHILRGDCYELNFCQEFFAESAAIDPVAIYKKLCEISPMPFAYYYKLDDKFLLCASPERYIKKTGNVIISQPIKGTAKRNIANREEDEQFKAALYNSSKDRSENVMVVDLVRNDLSKICHEGTVEAEELFGIYSFPQVHQMISTIKGVLRDGIDLADILRATFPMGSMTGAPKKKVMELIEQYETVKRGMFSGTVGYITPNGDFDFNVVIRSIMYNATTQYLNYLVGSAITFYSKPEDEYEECLLKADAIERVLRPYGGKQSLSL